MLATADTWLHRRCLAAGPPDRPLTSAGTARPWTWRRWLDILFLCRAASFLSWTKKICTGREVLIIYQQYRATACRAQGAVGVIPWFDLWGRFFVDVWSFLCFDTVPDLRFPLRLEMERGWQLYKTTTAKNFQWVHFKTCIYWTTGTFSMKHYILHERVRKFMLNTAHAQHLYKLQAAAAFPEVKNHL